MTEVTHSMETSSPSRSITVENARAVTPHNEALYEAGKALLVESVSVGRDFCKDMIGVSASGIVAYLGLLKFVLGDKYVPGASEAAVDLIPAALFLIAMVLFVIGYLPGIASISLDLPDDIERERARTVKHRHLFAIVALTVFCLGVGVGLVTTARAIAHQRGGASTNEAQGVPSGGGVNRQPHP